MSEKLHTLVRRSARRLRYDPRAQNDVQALHALADMLMTDQGHSPLTMATLHYRLRATRWLWGFVYRLLRRWT